MISRVLAFLVFLSAASGARVAPKEDTLPPKRIPPLAEQVFREVRTIPYPNGSVYVREGIAGAFLGGKHKNRGEKSLYQWQGEVNYFYTPFFSAGAGFRITAGEPSDSAQKIRNRYFLHGRFHKAWSNAAIYIGPQLGLDNLNVLTDSSADSSQGGSVFNKTIENTNAGLALEAGGGWRFNRWGGLTLGTNLEYSLVGEGGASENLNLHILPGLAVDLLAFTDTLRELVPAMYFVVEFQQGFLLFEKDRFRTDQTVVMGFSVAF